MVVTFERITLSEDPRRGRAQAGRDADRDLWLPEHIRSDNESGFIAQGQLWTLSEARVVIEGWRLEYNTLRPHKRLSLSLSLSLETPLAFAGASAALAAILDA